MPEHRTARAEMARYDLDPDHVVVAFLVVWALFWFLSRTRTGKAMRAFLGVLAEFTLQDLVKDSDKMCGLLDLEIPVREA